MFIVSDQILSEKKDKDKVGDLVRSMLPLTIVTCPEEVTDLLQLLQSLIDSSKLSLEITSKLLLRINQTLLLKTCTQD